MRNPTPKSAALALFGIVGLVWAGLTLVALAKTISGGNPFYSLAAGSHTVLELSLFGKVYLVTSGIMPFIVLAAVAIA